MANPNSYQAYKEVTPLGNGISEDMKYWNEDGYKRRKEADEKAEKRKKAEEEKKAKRKNLFKEIYKDLKLDDSRSTSYNEVVGKSLMSLKEDYLPIMEILSNPNRTDEQEFKARMRLAQIHEAPDKLNMITKKIAERNAQYAEDKEKGLVFEEPDYEDLFRNGYKGMEVKWDENMNPIVAYRDLDGDNVNDFETFEEITGAEPSAFKFQKKYDLDKLASEAADDKDGGLGYRDETTGRYTKTTQNKEIKEAAVKDYAKRVMIDNEGNPTDVALSELRKRKLDITPENITLVTEDFEKMIKDRANELYKEEFKIYPVQSNGNGRTTKKEDPISFGGAVTPSKENWGAIHSELNIKDYNSVSVTGVIVPALKTDQGEFTDLTVTNYTYDKNNKLVFDGYVQDEKTITKEKYDRIIQQAKEENRNVVQLMADYQKIDGDKYVYKGKKRKVQARVNPEDELAFSEALGETIEDTRDRARKNQDKTIFD